jgi:choline dehydrogenase
MMIDPFAADTARITAGLRIGMYSFVNLAKSSGELRITSADPKDTPFLDLRYFEDAFDLKRMREIIRTCVDIGEHEAFNQIIESRIAPTDVELESDNALDEFIRRTVVSAQHLSGTCKMGPSSDSMAVVDQYGSVHGIHGLRVADASIMPDCIRANTNLTTMMIGERIADFIRQA